MKFKKLALSLSLPIALTTPLVAIACGGETKNPVVKQLSLDEIKNTDQYKTYQTAYKKYNDTIKEKADQAAKLFKEQFGKFTGTEEEKKAAAAAKLEIYKQYVKTNHPAILKLRQEADKAFKALSDSLKGQDIQIIKFMQTNDEHGRIEERLSKYNKEIGMLNLSKFISSSYSEALLSGGDTTQGYPFSDKDKGLTIAKIAGLMGYDALAVGNHELDFTYNNINKIEKELKSLANNAKGTEFLSANIVFNSKINDNTATAQEFKKSFPNAKVGEYAFPTHKIVTLPNGLKMGVIGLTTPEATFTSHPRNTEFLDIKDPVEAAKPILEELNKQGADFTVAVVHLGVNPSTKVEWQSTYLAKNLPGLDYIVDGHSHTYNEVYSENNVEGNDSKTYIAQTGAHLERILETDMFVSKKTKSIIEKPVQHSREVFDVALQVDGLAIADGIKSVYDALKKEYEAWAKIIIFNSPIAFTNITEVKVSEYGNEGFWVGRVKPTNLGVWTSDANVRKLYDGVESLTTNKPETPLTLDNTIGLTNGGGLRENTDAGDITNEKLLAISPFGNGLRGIEVSGEDLLEVIRHGVKKLGSGGYAQYSSNVKFEIVKNPAAKEKKDPKFMLKEGTVRINDKEVVPTQKYYVATNDFIASGGDQYTMLKYTAPNSKAKLVYEGTDLIDSYKDYAKYLNSINDTEASTISDQFGKHKWAYYANPGTNLYQADNNWSTNIVTSVAAVQE